MPNLQALVYAKTLALRIVRRPVAGLDAKGSGTGRCVKSGTGRTLIILGATICKRRLILQLGVTNQKLLLSRKAAFQYYQKAVLSQDYPKDMFKR
ncbi:MAG: hypothetical protein V3S13_01210 [Candidatus Omnitrophota bacterium]